MVARLERVKKKEDRKNKLIHGDTTHATTFTSINQKWSVEAKNRQGGITNYVLNILSKRKMPILRYTLLMRNRTAIQSSLKICTKSRAY